MASRSIYDRLDQKNQAVNNMVQNGGFTGMGTPQPQQPAIKPADGNYIGMMRDMLGPTPEERDAQERKLAENRAKMNGWLGLFQGLGALGDLYYASKGVNPSKPDYTAQETLNQQLTDQKQRLDNLARNRQAYATQLYNLQRQADIDRENRDYKKAQGNYLNNKTEIMSKDAEIRALKAENDRLVKEAQANLIKERQNTEKSRQEVNKSSQARNYAASELSRAKANTERNKPAGGGTKNKGKNGGKSGAVVITKNRI